MTSGEIERVDPVSLTKNFSKILSNPIIASNVIVKAKLHKGLKFRNEDDSNLFADKSLLVRDIGNVTKECEITMEYTLKNIADLVKMEDLDLTQLKSLSFQLQIEYNDLDGNKCVRVITNNQDLSSDKKQVEEEAKFEVLGAHVARKGAEMAMRGDHKEAQAFAKGWNRKMKACSVKPEQVAQRSQFVDEMKEVYKMMGEQDSIEQTAKALPMLNERPAMSKMSDAYSAQLFKKKKGKK